MKTTYLVITGAGYWGRADNALEAAQNANVRGTYISASIYRTFDDWTERLDCNDWGSASWTYTGLVRDLLVKEEIIVDGMHRDREVNHLIRGLAQNAIQVGTGKARIHGGKLQFVIEFEGGE